MTMVVPSRIELESDGYKPSALPLSYGTVNEAACSPQGVRCLARRVMLTPLHTSTHYELHFHTKYEPEFAAMESHDDER